MADATLRPMKVPVTYVPYLEKHRVYEIFQELLCRVIIKRPDDHLEFLKNEILKLVSTAIGKNSNEYKVKDESKRRESISSHTNILSDEGINANFGTEMSESDGMAEEDGGVKGREAVERSIAYHMDETLAGMSKEEFKNFSEEVISNWRTIRRSNKFFNVREIPSYKHKQEERDTETDEDYSDDNSITLIFQIRESNNENMKENSQLDEGSVNYSNLKLNQSIKSLDIKIKTEGKVTSDTSIPHSIGDEIVTVSYVESDSIINKERSNEQVIQVKLLQGIPSSDSNEIKEYVMKLVKEMVEEIISELPKHSLSCINLNFFEQAKKSKKKIHFPRGPIMIPRVVLFGPPGSGKHLQAKLLTKALKLIHVDMVLLLLASATTLGKIEKRNLFRKYSLTGEQMINESSIKILQERLLQEDCLKNGWVLTGYPATAAHASLLDNIETPPNRIIYLDKPLEHCREFLSTRMFDVDTGEVGFIQPEAPKINGIPSKSTELMAEIENIVDIFGIHTDQMDAIGGYMVELSQGKGKCHKLLHNVLECPHQRKRFLRAPEDDPKFVDLRFKCHAAFKSELLKYYGGWCTKLNIGSLLPKRIHEAILHVITSPFPSLEDAPIVDRSRGSRLYSIYKFGGQIEEKLKFEMMKFFSSMNKRKLFQ